jgi:chemotaxis protein MotA
MALALLTTLYGAFLANVFCLPLADKLKVRSQEEALTMTLCVEAAVGIAEKQNPRAIEQALQSFIAPKLRGQS